MMVRTYNTFAIIFVSCLEMAHRSSPSIFDPKDTARYIGCYYLRMEGIHRMPDHKDWFDNNNNDYCIDNCKNKGFAYAGTRWEDCHCGRFEREYGEVGKLENRDCNHRCGDYTTHQKCGSYRKGLLSVYRVCGKNTFGDDCKQTCHCPANNSYCNPSNGECRCAHGYYNSDCSGQCHCLPLVPCDRDGKCNSARGERCAAGFTDFPRCNKSCRHGYYGEDCKEICSNCSDFGCDPVNGICEPSPEPNLPSKSANLSDAVSSYVIAALLIVLMF